MANALRFLLNRLELEPPLFGYDEAQQHLDFQVEVWVKKGLVCPAPNSNTASCLDCDGFINRVKAIQNRCDGTTSLVMGCINCGIVPIHPDRLKRWRADLSGWLDELKALADIKGLSQELIANKLWRLGRAKWAGRSREIYLVRNYESREGPTIVQELEKRPRATILMPTQERAERWKRVAPQVTMGLDVILECEGSQIDLNREEVECSYEEIDAALKSKPKKPAKRASRAAGIEKLILELKDHLLSAKDHLLSTGKLLPRPTQKMLAQLTGLSATTVSRSLKDGSASTLRLMWEMANDIDQVRQWRSR